MVDDEADSQALLMRVLDSAGYECRTASNGLSGLRVFFSWKPDLVVLDILMPVMDGWELLGRIRQVSDVPVLMLTTLGQVEDRVRGLRKGADDYLPKPFSIDELHARVDALLRRVSRRREAVEESSEGAYRDGEIEVDFLYHRVLVRGSEVELSPLEFRLLSALVRWPGQVLSSDRLLDLCWAEKDIGHSNLRAYMTFLRRKIEVNPSRPQLVQTVRGFGYRYVSPSQQ